MPTIRACVTLMAVAALALPAAGQSVISTRAGVIYYFDGSVYLGDQPLQPHLGTFPAVPRGAELRTTKGRAEVLLTPGVFLRVGQDSSIRMIANSLADTRVELRSGSAILDSGEPNAGTSVTLIFKDWQIHSAQAGMFRIDADPPCLWVLQGQAEVTAGAGGQPVSVEEGMDLPFASVLVPERSIDPPVDGLTNWAKGRSDSIVADNTITQQIGGDPASQSAGGDSFSYFPYIGLPAAGISSPYSSIYLSQPGFYSMYLPGYTYQPFMFGIIGRGTLTGRLPVLPLRLGGISPLSPGLGGVINRRPLGSTGIHPSTLAVPRAAPPRPVMARPAFHR